jgi:hypothetical protein
MIDKYMLLIRCFKILVASIQLFTLLDLLLMSDFKVIYKDLISYQKFIKLLNHNINKEKILNKE